MGRDLHLARNGSTIAARKGKQPRQIAVVALPAAPVEQGARVVSSHEFEQALIEFVTAWTRDLIEQGVFVIVDGTLCVRKDAP